MSSSSFFPPPSSCSDDFATSEQPTAEVNVTWSSFPPSAPEDDEIEVIFDSDDDLLVPLLQRSPSARPTKRMATGTRFRLLPGLTPTAAPAAAKTTSHSDLPVVKRVA